MQPYPYVITISSEKGGGGKTTLACNLAVYLRALRESLPVTILSFDNHFTIDRMFALEGQKLHGTVREMLEGQPAGALAHTGQYGVGYIPSSTAERLTPLLERFRDPRTLAGGAPGRSRAPRSGPGGRALPRRAPRAGPHPRHGRAVLNVVGQEK
ncbi:hypothetical protein [Oryzomonas sagensis]|uniref:ParA family protein n=1 Tax=Oryzomonas sagensis TaxID=2603857 RepID=UPI003083FC42